MAVRNPESLTTLYREYLAALVLFHQSAAQAAGLGATDYQALNLLDLRGPLTPGALSAALGLTTGATTRLIDRLVAGGYAERSADPHDRRKITVTASVGRAEFESLFAGVQRDLGSYLGGLGADQLETLAGYLEAAVKSYSAAVTDLAERGRGADDGLPANG